MIGRVVRFATTGDPANVLTVTRESVAPPGPGQVVVRVRCRPINPSDLLFVEGRYARAPHLPSAVGYEGAGVVVAVGADVSVAVGTRCLVDTLGTWSDLLVVDVADIVPIIADIDDEHACMIGINPLSAWLLLDDLALPAGAWLLLTAGASAIGQCLVALARARALRTICTVRRASHGDLLIDLGVDAVIDTSFQDVRSEVLRLTAGAGVSAALDAIGGAPGSEALACVAPGGAMIAYGMLSRTPLSIAPELLIFGRVHVRGFWLPAHLERSGPAASEAALRAVIACVERRELAPRIEARYELADVQAAVCHAAREGRLGKILLISEDDA